MWPTFATGWGSDMGAVSPLLNPPKGSELAARVQVLMNAGFAPDHPLTTNPVLIEKGELDEVLREPRSWKLPTGLVARNILPYDFKIRYGEQVVAQLEKCPDLAQAAARLFQDLDFKRSSTAERAKEPTSDHRITAMMVIFAEYQAIKRKNPNFGDSQCCRAAGINLGTRWRRIDRNTIRRAVQKFEVAADRQHERTLTALMKTVILIADLDWPAVHSEHHFQSSNEQDRGRSSGSGGLRLR